jgi:hypothetical protein
MNGGWRSRRRCAIGNLREFGGPPLSIVVLTTPSGPIAEGGACVGGRRGWATLGGARGPWQEAQSAMGKIGCDLPRSDFAIAQGHAFGLAPMLMALMTTVTGVAHDRIMAPSNVRAPC